jgi:hypothetical protein
MTDDRIEAFLRAVLSNQGVNPNEIREATRSRPKKQKTNRGVGCDEVYSSEAIRR